MIETIFNDSLYAIDLNRSLSPNDCVEIQRTQENIIRSNEGGYHSDNLIHLPLLAPLIQTIREHATIYANDLGLQSHLNVKNIWLNINGYGNYNKPHVHPQSCLSGVYYVTCPQNSGQIKFIRENNKLIDSYWLHYKKKETPYSWNEFGVPPRAGLLLLFPSYMEHYVEPNRNERLPRMSFSFNLS